MKKYIVVSVLLLTSLGASAQSTKAVNTSVKETAVTRKAAQAPMDWASLKQELLSMAARFSDKRVSDKAKVSMLPHANEVLSGVQDLKLSAPEKEEQIQVVVAFLAASFAADFANSNTNTIYYDYKAHKSAYLKEINKLKGSVRSELIEAFKDWEAFERNAGSPESE